MEEKIPDGYYIPSHKSLQEEVLWAGVPKDFMALNFTFGLAIGLMQKIYPFVLVSLILHFVARKMTKQDPQFFKALLRHINEKRFYGV